MCSSKEASLHLNTHKLLSTVAVNQGVSGTFAKIYSKEGSKYKNKGTTSETGKTLEQNQTPRQEPRGNSGGGYNPKGTVDCGGTYTGTIKQGARNSRRNGGTSH